MSHVNDFNARDRASLIAAYAEGTPDGLARAERLWETADLRRAHGERDPKEAAIQAVLEVYLALPAEAC
jgi:hypothetical protein